MAEPAAPILIVAGLGRCGSSLAMRMLAAAGVPCAGTFPDFEDPRAVERPISAAWLAAQAGRAVKVLDPHKVGLTAAVPGPALWLDRDPAEQARSQAKFLREMVGVAVDRAARRAIEQSLKVERRAALQAIAGRPVFGLAFEDFVARPGPTAEAIARFIEPWFPGLDPAVMAAQVRPRDPRCAPHMHMELALLAEAEQRR